MIKKSGLSQNKFAKEILGIAGGNVTEARKSGKIPDRWFTVMEEKFGVTREDLTTDPTEDELGYKPGSLRTPSFGGMVMPYGEASAKEERDHFLREMNAFFQAIISWQADEHGMDSLTSMNFIREFNERFPEFGDWLKKQKGGGHKDTGSENIIADGTDG